MCCSAQDSFDAHIELDLGRDRWFDIVFIVVVVNVIAFFATAADIIYPIPTIPFHSLANDHSYHDRCSSSHHLPINGSGQNSMLRSSLTNEILSVCVLHMTHTDEGKNVGVLHCFCV